MILQLQTRRKRNCIPWWNRLYGAAISNSEILDLRIQVDLLQFYAVILHTYSWNNFFPCRPHLLPFFLIKFCLQATFSIFLLWCVGTCASIHASLLVQFYTENRQDKKRRRSSSNCVNSTVSTRICDNGSVLFITPFSTTEWIWH